MSVSRYLLTVAKKQEAQNVLGTVILADQGSIDVSQEGEISLVRAVHGL